MIARYSYDEFGVPDPEGKFDSHAHHGNVYGFTGENYDQVTDLLYLRARYYMPEVGRFMTQDWVKKYFPRNPKLLPSYLKLSSVLTKSGSVSLGLHMLDQTQKQMIPLSNAYLYARNNPINLIDHSGYDAVSIGLAMGGFAAGVAAIVGVVAGVPAVVTVGTVAALTFATASIAYSTYLYATSQIPVEQHVVSTILATGSAIPYVGPYYGGAAIGWETATTVAPIKAR